jgi:hypothetical protein
VGKPSNLELEDTLQKYGREYRTAYHNYGHTIFDPVSHTIMFSWVDSLIADSYTHLGLDEELRVKNSELKIDVYPNPVSRVVNVQYYLESPEDIELVVINHLGQMVMQLPGGNKPVGPHHERVDVSCLPVGIFFIRIASRNGMKLTKFIKK